MSTARKKIFVFAIAGLLSGILCGMGQYFLADDGIISDYYPALVLGITLYLCGRYILNIKSGDTLLSLIILIIACSIGWQSSIQIAFGLGGPVPFVNAGALGAFFVAIGWLLAWKIRSGIVLSIIIITTSGALGGLAFHFIDKLLEYDDELWTVILFSEWQCILLAGIAIAHTLRKA